MRRSVPVTFLVFLFQLSLLSSAFGITLPEFKYPNKSANKGTSEVLSATEDISKRTEYSTVWKTKVRENGKVRDGKYTQLTPGLFYNAGTKENPKFEKPDTNLQVTDNGAVVKRIGQPIQFSKNLNFSQPVIEQKLGGSPILSATPTLIIYRDTQTDRTVVLAQGKDAELSIKDNVATYSNAFSGLHADLRYTVDPAQVEQDVLLYEKPKAPSAYGLNDDTTRFVVLTRLFHLDSDNPTIIHSWNENEQSANNKASQGWAKVSTAPSSSKFETNSLNVLETPTKEAIYFDRDGEVVQGFTRSYALDGKEKHPVDKRIVILQGMHFLAEEIPAKLILEQDLPQVSHDVAQAPVEFKTLDVTALLKKQPEEVGKLAQLAIRNSGTETDSTLADRKVFIMDFISVPSTVTTPFTFGFGETYYIEGNVVMSDTVTFQPYTVVKYRENSATPPTTSSLEITTEPQFETISALWAAFTSMNDDSLGELINDPLSGPVSNGNPQLAVATHLILHSGTVQYAEFHYGIVGVQFVGSGGTLTIKDSALVGNIIGVIGDGNSGTSTLSLNNVLVSSGGDGIKVNDTTGNPLVIDAYNLTILGMAASGFDSTLNETGSSLSVKDSLFVNVTGDSFKGTTPTTEDYNAFFNVGTSGSGSNNQALIEDPILTNFFLKQDTPNPPNPPNPPDPTVIDTGSRTAVNAGFYHYRTNPDGTIEAGTQVDIGFHQLPLYFENAVLAENSVLIEEGAVVRGQIRVNTDNPVNPIGGGTDALLVESNVTLDATNTLVADSIKIDNLSTGPQASADVHYSSSFSGDTSGTQFPNAQFRIFDTFHPVFPAGVNPSADDYDVIFNQTENKGPGDFLDGIKTLTVQSGATLILDGGLYSMNDLVLEIGAKLLFNGPVTFLVKNKVEFGQDTIIDINIGVETVETTNIVFFIENDLQETTSLNFGPRSYALGVFYAQNGDVLLGADANLQGILIGNNVTLGSSSLTTQIQGGENPSATAPSFSPIDSSGVTVITESSKIILSTPTPGATILYTKDGITDPADQAGGQTLLYNGPIDNLTPQEADYTIKAKAVRTGYVTSPIVTVVYRLQPTVSAVVASPAPATGPFETTVTVNLSSATPGATIHYTIDGTDPDGSSPVFGSDLTFTEDKLIKTFAEKTNNNPSQITEFFFSVHNIPGSIDTATPIDDNLVYDFLDSVKFLYDGSPATQTGVVTANIDSLRTAVVRGRVMEEDLVNGGLKALPGVKVTILNNPDYGETLTRSDGYYDMVVNGGGSYIVQYELVGKLTSQRTVAVPIQEYSIMDDVALIPPDPLETTVNINGAGAFQTVQSTELETGTALERRTTLLIPSGSTPKMVVDGVVTPMTSLSAFKVTITDVALSNLGSAGLVASLPSQLAFNHTVKISVDEAEAAGAELVIFEDNPVPANQDWFILYIPEPSGLESSTSLSWTSEYNSNDGSWTSTPNLWRVFKKIGETNGMADLEFNPPPGVTWTPASFSISNDELIKIAEIFPQNDVSFVRILTKRIGVNYIGFPFGIEEEEVTP